MNLSHAKTLAESLITEHELHDWTFHFDKAVKRFGVCDQTFRRISLSKKLTELNSEEEVRDCILHEIAHALCGHANGHNIVWKNKAREIGARPIRCYSREVTGVEHKLTYQCSACEKTFKRHRRLNRNSTYSHRGCKNSELIEIKS